MDIPPELAAHARRSTRLIPDGRERRDAYAELLDGLLCSYEDALTEGLSPDEALHRTLTIAGSPDDSAPNYDRAHRIGWSAGTVALMIGGIVAFVTLFVLIINLLFFLFR